MPRFLVRAFSCPKLGSTPSEYEDDVRWNRGARGRRAARRYAVADGASESSFARAWASRLTQAYVYGRLSAGSLTADLVPLQAQWRAAVAAKPLPWYAAEKARAGAFSALAGLTLHPDRSWTALAVGDCCIMHLREDVLLRSFPLSSPEQFGISPVLICSNPERNARLDGSLTTACGEWSLGDTFWLMSDALAAYTLGAVREGSSLPTEALPPTDPAESHAWLQRLRDERRIRNDDVSLLRVHILDERMPTKRQAAAEDRAITDAERVQ